MEQAYEIASILTGSAQSTHKQDHLHSIEHPDGACQHTLPSIFGLIQGSPYGIKAKLAL